MIGSILSVWLAAGLALGLLIGGFAWIGAGR